MTAGIEHILRRDRMLVSVALSVVMLLAWSYVLAGAGSAMSPGSDWTGAQHDGMAMGPGSREPSTQSASWTPGYAALMFAMWWVMMVAMMLPSATPTVLLAAALNRRLQPERAPYGSSGSFVAGYLTGWALFSLIAVLAQWGLAASGTFSSMLRTTSPMIAGGLLVAAGAWQLTPLKRTCLRHCRSPIEHLTRRRRDGEVGALLMGLEHGFYCLGCCWVLMALLFVGGVMSLYWIIGLAIYVWIEKQSPFGARISVLVGALLVAWGMVLIMGGM